MELQEKVSNGEPMELKSLETASNLTAQINLNEIKPAGDRVLIALKAWPAQSVKGVFMPESHTIIRGEMYVAEVIGKGTNTSLVNEGDIVVISMYSGYHVATKTGHAKIISESDILIYKTKADMKNAQSFDPKTFKPGINHVLIELLENKEVVTEGNIILNEAAVGSMNENEAATKSAKILAFGEINQYGLDYRSEGVGSVIILDSYVGLTLNTVDTADSDKYRVMLTTDILGFIDKK